VHGVVHPRGETRGAAAEIEGGGAEGASVAIEGGGAVTSEAEAVRGSSSPRIRGGHVVDKAGGITLKSKSVLPSAD
jgi:hypothetical protein